MMEGRIVGAGRMARPMDMASVPDQRGKESTRALGATVSRWWEYTPGRVAILTREHGHRGRDTASEWKAKGNGSTKENGATDSRDDMGRGRALAPEPSMRERGTTGFKMDTEQRPIEMEVG